jgi:MFS family permease
MTLNRALWSEDGKMVTEQDFQILPLANMVPPLGVSVLSPILDSLDFRLRNRAHEDRIDDLLPYTAPEILVNPLAGILSDRYGRKRNLASSLVLFGFCGTAIVLTKAYCIVLTRRLF